jgi:hypothetical protein
MRPLPETQPGAVMEAKVAKTYTAPAVRDIDRGIRENKLATVGSRSGVSLRFRTHQVTTVLLDSYLNENPRIQKPRFEGGKEIACWIRN